MNLQEHRKTIRWKGGEGASGDGSL